MKPLDPQKEEKIITAVIQIVGEYGISGINMSLVSKTAGISVGTLYTYFKGKDEIIRVAYRRTANRLTYTMYEGFSLNEPIKSSLRTLFEKALEYRTKHFNENILIDQYVHSKYVIMDSKTYALEYKERNMPLVELLEKGQKFNVFKLVNVEVLINFFHGSIRSLSNAIVQQLIPYNENIIDNYFEMIWSGVTIQPKESSRRKASISSDA